MTETQIDRRKGDGWYWVILLAGLFGLLETTLRVLSWHATSLTLGDYVILLGLSFVTYALLIGVPILIAKVIPRRGLVTDGALTVALAVFVWAALIWHTVLEAGVKWYSVSGILGTLAAGCIGLAMLILFRKMSAARLTMVVGIVGVALALVPLARLDRSAKDQQQPETPEQGWTFVLLTDTVGARHLSLYGYERETSPNLDEFAEGAVVFDHAVSTSSWTRPSVTSLMTGLYLQHHNKDAGVSYLRPECLIFPELFSEHGYATAAFSSSGVVSELSNFDQGFRHFDDTCAGQSVRQIYWHMYLVHYGLGKVVPAIKAEITKPIRRRAENVNELFYRWYETNDLPGGLVYLHYFDAHGPYVPPEEFAKFGPTPEDLHDGEILYWDSQFGAFIDYLKEQGIYDDATIVVTSDHGEEFYEHGSTGHGQSLYEELIHVPLLIKTPGVASRRVAQTVSLVDVAPTLLEIHELPDLVYKDGISLMPTLRGEALPDRIVRSRVHHIQNTFRQALIRSPWKTIIQPDNGWAELYNLDEDPLEQDDVAVENPDVIAQLVSDAGGGTAVSYLPVQAVTGEDFDVSPELQHTLKALGYIQ